MLPYRLRAPTFATKEFRAKKQEQESNDEILSGGGPIQRAMEKDLIELRIRFLEEIGKLSATPQQQHVSAGDVFKCFRQVFGQAKVALVHTRTLPPRSDRGSYTQLVYSACLSLLKCSFKDDNMVHAAFSVFCLYVLYETCPLPTEPSSPLQSLPMGLQHPDNPKFLYRRSFRLPVRIDRYHYSLLQRLRDEALARQADCQCARMNALESRLGDNTDATEWSCTCGPFIDIVEVVDRLMPSLDLVEYTGPAGLEALAGHADYPYGCTRPKKANRQRTPEVNVVEPSVTRLTNEEMDGIVAMEPTARPPSDNFEQSTNDYHAQLKGIHLGPANGSGSNQAIRVRNALKPIFDQSPGTAAHEVHPANTEGDNEVMNDSQSSSLDAETLVSTPATASQPPQEPIEAPPGSARDENATEETIHENPIKSALDDLGWQLVFSTDLTEAQRDGIRAALSSAIEMGDTTLIDRAGGASSDNGEQNEDNSVGSPTTDNFNDGGVHARGDTRGQGAIALQNLLLEASVGATAVRRQGAVSTNTSGNLFGSSFLTTNSQLHAEELSAESGHSDAMSVSSEGSSASAVVGGIPLDTLWSVIDEKGEQPTSRKHKRKKRKRQPPSSRGKGPRRTARSRTSGKSRTPKRSKASDDQLNFSGEDSDGSIEVGRTSLHALLAAVEERDGEPTTHQQESTKRERGQAFSSGEGPQRSKRKSKRSKSHVRKSDDPPSMSSEESVAGAGQSALRSLFSAVGGQDGELSPQRHSQQRRALPFAIDGSVDGNSRARRSHEASERDDDSHSTEFEDESVASSQGPGKAALGALLSLATQDHNDND